MLTSLRESQWFSAAEIQQRQLAALSNTVTQAAEMEYYRRRGLRPIDFRSLDQLLELPMLTKGDVQRAGRDMIAERFRKHRLTAIHTGGSTGMPLEIHCDSATLQRLYAFFSRIKETAGVHDGAPRRIGHGGPGDLHLEPPSADGTGRGRLVRPRR